MEICYPDYDESLLSLTASVLRHYGAETGHKSLPELDDLLAKKPKNVVILLFDGMGPSLLAQHLPEDSFLRRHVARTLSSVFPPTTTAATTTMESGLSPIEHGWLGWSLFFEELGANIDIFPNTLTENNTVKAADYNVAHRYTPYKTIFEKIEAATGGAVQAFCVSPFSVFSRHKAKSAEETCRIVADLCREPGGRYIFAYWPQPDSSEHKLGTGHPDITALLQDIDHQVEALCAELTDSLVIVTADHGLTDNTTLLLADYPDIMDCLVRNPSLEARALSFFIKSGRCGDFEKAFAAHFAEHYKLFTHQEVMDLALFGPGTPHPRSWGFIGDYLAVATGTVTLIPDGCPTHPAAHAGFTALERDIPFIVVDKTGR